MIIFKGAWRVFFPVAGLFAALAIPVWLVLFQGADVAWPQDGLRWHRHEMLFGYLGAALAGFLFTAVPNWTGRAALAGGKLAMLVALWLIARASVFFLPDGSPPELVGALSFPVAVALLITREIVAGGNKRNFPMVVMVWLMAAAQVTFLLGHDALAQRLGFALALMMITLIGGRVTPTFSRNWLKAQGREAEVAAVGSFGMADKAAMALSALALLGWVVFDEALFVGVLAGLAAVAQLARLAQWKGWRVRREPLLAALHLGYAWVPVALLMLSLTLLGADVTQSQTLHAMGAGAVGGMTLIVMIRAILGHNNMPIKGTALDVVLLGMVHLGALLRIATDWLGAPTWAYHGSGTLWALGFLIFVIRYSKIAAKPRQS